VRRSRLSAAAVVGGVLGDGLPEALVLPLSSSEAAWSTMNPPQHSRQITAATPMMPSTIGVLLFFFGGGPGGG
jgi:hypothetical protein